MQFDFIARLPFPGCRQRRRLILMLALLYDLCADCNGTFRPQYTVSETIPHFGHEVHFLLPDTKPMLSADADRSDLTS